MTPPGAHAAAVGSPAAVAWARAAGLACLVRGLTCRGELGFVVSRFASAEDEMGERSVAIAALVLGVVLVVAGAMAWTCAERCSAARTMGLALAIVSSLASLAWIAWRMTRGQSEFIPLTAVMYALQVSADGAPDMACGMLAVIAAWRRRPSELSRGAAGMAESIATAWQRATGAVASLVGGLVASVWAYLTIHPNVPGRMWEHLAMLPLPVVTLVSGALALATARSPRAKRIAVLAAISAAGSIWLADAARVRLRQGGEVGWLVLGVLRDGQPGLLLMALGFAAIVATARERVTGAADAPSAA